MKDFRIEKLAGQGVSHFACGLDAPSDYLRLMAKKDMQRTGAMTFVAVEPRGLQVIGFYTLAPKIVTYYDVQTRSDKTTRVIMLKHLAYDVNVASPELGTALLADATARAKHKDIGVNVMVVLVQSEQHSQDFERFGFTRDPGNPKRLFGRLDAITARR